MIGKCGFSVLVGPILGADFEAPYDLLIRIKRSALAVHMITPYPNSD